jgi:hypothetical protein
VKLDVGVEIDSGHAAYLSRPKEVVDRPEGVSSRGAQRPHPGWGIGGSTRHPRMSLSAKVSCGWSPTAPVLHQPLEAPTDRYELQPPPERR